MVRVSSKADGVVRGLLGYTVQLDLYFHPVRTVTSVGGAARAACINCKVFHASMPGAKYVLVWCPGGGVRLIPPIVRSARAD